VDDPVAAVRIARPDDEAALATLRHLLWPEGSESGHARELRAILAGEPPGSLPYVVFVSEAGERIIGFAEVGLRSHADGCDPRGPVGFLEGWYVAEGERRNGAGAALMRAAEQWARDLGCTEMASDTWIDADISQRAHEALGFEVVDRCVHSAKLCEANDHSLGVTARARGSAPARSSHR
jgi:aminoglycoside 6'-N-acetyltransferase I